MNTAPISQMTAYDDCAELTHEQFVAVFDDNSDADFFYRLVLELLIFAIFPAAGMGVSLYTDS